MKRGEKDPLLRRIVSGVLVAVIPAMLAYVVSFVDGRRREELTYVNSQIEKLYGPLDALTHANDVAWEQFVSADWPVGTGRYFFDPMRPPTIEQVDKWRLWMTTVFQPLNMEMETRIINNSQLILGRQMPTAFKDLIAQTEAYKAVIATWKESDRQDQRAYTPDSTIRLPDSTIRQTFANVRWARCFRRRRSSGAGTIASSTSSTSCRSSARPRPGAGSRGSRTPRRGRGGA